MSLQHTHSVSNQAQCSLTCVVALCGQMIMYNGQPIAQSPKANVRTEHPKKAYLSVHDTKQYTKVVTLGEVDSLPASNMKLDDQVPLIRGQAKAAAGATALQLPEKCTLRSVPNLLDNSASFMVTGATRQQVHRSWSLTKSRYTTHSPGFKLLIFSFTSFLCVSYCRICCSYI